MIYSINEIINILYINLENRKDRKDQVEQELTNVGFTRFQRFNAIKIDNGAIGCSMSHLKCLLTAKENKWSHVLIVEDDIEFLNPQLFKNQFNLFLKKHIGWDVVILSGNNCPPFTTVDETCVKVSRCQTTTGYLVKQDYYDVLINNFRESINNLLR